MSKQEGNALVRGKDIKGTVVVLSKTQPQQLSLFQTFLPADERYSNSWKGAFGDSDVPQVTLL